MGHRTTQRFLIHIFIRHSLHHVRARYKHLALFLHHQDEVCQCRAVARTTGTGAEDGADLWDDTRCHHIPSEDMCETCQTLHTFLNTCPTRVIQSDDGRSVLQCQVLHLRNLLGIGSRKRATQHSKVKGIDKHDASVYLTIARNDAITFDALILHTEVIATVHHVLIHLHERATVKQRFYSFSCSEFIHCFLFL